MRVVVIGSGYVGLVSGACFADFGHNVTCVDQDAAKIAALTRGEIPIYEPGLSDLVAANLQQGRLAFTTELDAVRSADAVFIAVGTPSRQPIAIDNPTGMDMPTCLSCIPPHANWRRCCPMAR